MEKTGQDQKFGLCNWTRVIFLFSFSFCSVLLEDVYITEYRLRSVVSCGNYLCVGSFH